ncbi:MAG: hypothetical protein SPF89_02185 [Sphaerochaetaceae bacterium]|nr:hypothetical protein [Spirochaetales bacterium]MDY5498895.1 hypothetical protein [Sphaerochaetaceae bacterium]
MITLEEAQAIARKFTIFPYPDDLGNETDDCWIFSFGLPPGPDGKLPGPGCYQYVSVDKADGKATDIHMPSKEAFALLDRSRTIHLHWD